MVIKMAKPIEATPTLQGKDAEEFLQNLIRPKYTEKEKELFREAEKLKARLPKRQE